MKKKVYFIIFAVIILIVIILGIFFYYHLNNSNEPFDKYSFKDNTFHYSQNRGTPVFSMIFRNESENFTVYNISFASRNFLQYNTTIYGILFVPKNKTNFPGIVMLPGGGVGKEGQMFLASRISNLGYSVLTIDQRGIGQTGGYYLSLDDDYSVFLKGNEPVQYLSVYDALKSFDVISEVKGIDKKKISMGGESMGGRYAMIAAGMDSRINGVLIISSSGFNIQNDSTNPASNFLISIDPDHYVPFINGAFIMIQGNNDSVISIESAQKTFSLAKEPKKFYIADKSGHGYNEKIMYSYLKEGLGILRKN